MEYREDLFSISEEGFSKDGVPNNGNKFILANGYMGYRGTLDGFTKDQLAAFTLAGFYDKVKGKNGETVNAPDPFYIKVYADGIPLDPLFTEPESHRQKLDLRRVEFSRCTSFAVNGKKIALCSSRVLCGDEYRGALSTFEITSDTDCDVEIVCGINSDVWDINGPHLEGICFKALEGGIICESFAQEKHVPLSVALIMDGIKADGFSGGIMKTSVSLKAGKACRIERYVAVCYGPEAGEAEGIARGLEAKGMKAALQAHYDYWEEQWKLNDVEIEGSDRAQLALRYSIYQLMILSPRRNGSIGARGMSSQVYKGAVFWDTEVFMLPFFLANDHRIARNLVMYRIETLDAAKRKAEHYGYEGAFYAWESQDGEDACSDFNITDLFTGRDVKTYFKDKQIHISADVVYGIDGYIKRTGDTSVLYEGGLKTMLECALFYYSRGYYNYIKGRYELLDVIGPDEYHERVNNNAYTNYAAYATIQCAISYYNQVLAENPEYATECVNSVKEGLIEKLTKFAAGLYLPQPNCSGVVEQYDGYFKEEDVLVDDVRKRLVDPREYWGGSAGVATATRVIKQGDVIVLMTLFPEYFSPAIIEANYDFYLKYTEHGSSLSPCMYAMDACWVGRPDDAWKWFLNTAEIDLNGSAKQWLGGLYIGGTHPAANGGAWLTAICGFAGVNMRGPEITLDPHLPKDIQSIRFCLTDKGRTYRYTVSRKGVEKEEL
ncbi:MAG: glycoside hydrolase family 65 protein [Clostridia bacterium]|nr:glycoside hydrolase family 65 protein [Clostridia bacterium]